MAIGTRLAWDGGLGLDFDATGGEFDPAVDAGPTVTGGSFVSVTTVDDTTRSGPITVPDVRVVSKPRQAYRIVVGGKDVTWFRGVHTPLPTYGLVSPMLYGSGSISFPQIHGAFARPGYGDLAWLKPFAPIKVQRLEDGVVVATDYRGILSDFTANGRDLTSVPGGEATGRAAMADRPIPIFPRPQDIGDLVMPAIQHVLRVAVANRPTTGVMLSDSGGGSQLDFLTEVLAKSTEHDGTQWTVMPNSSGAYRMFQKDTETITATVYIDGYRVVENLRRDFTEEPNRVWASGVDPDGKRVRFADIPGLAPAVTSFFFSGPYSPGDSGDAVTEIMWRLFTVGYLDDAPFATDWTTDPDDPITSAIEDLQDDAGLSQTGVVNAATWAALFNPDVTGYSLRRAMIRPAARRSYTEAFRHDATGNIIGPNPNYDRSAPFVDATVDMGSGFTRRQMAKWAKRELAPAGVSNWVGTITVTTGAVIDDEHNPGDALSTSDIREARSIKPGHNLWLPNWDDGTLVHVSGVTVRDDSVEFAVDTRARDTMKVWEVITRNRESRKSPARQWIAQNRRSGLRDDTGAFYDGSMFGRIPRTFCPANQTTVIATPAGRSGMLQLIDLHTSDTAAAFGLSIWGKQVDAGWLDRKLGDPFDTDFADHVERNHRNWQDNRGLIDVWGSKEQPCGYDPRSHTNAAGETTDAPITGDFRFKAGAPYLCQGSPVLWIAVRPDRDCWLQGGRVLELLLDDSAG